MSPALLSHIQNFFLVASPFVFIAALGGGAWIGYFRGFRQGLASGMDWSEKLAAKLGPDGEPIIPGDVIKQILEANITRHFSNFHRRTIKLVEELGELAEAYLNVTSTGNGKGMSYDDVREEAADCVIVAVDLALTPTPDQEDWTTEEVTQAMSDMIAKKLAKWRNNRDTGKSATDAE